MICLQCGRGLTAPRLDDMILYGVAWTWRERSRVFGDTMCNLYELRIVQRSDAERVGEWSDTGLAYIAHVLAICPTAYAPVLFTLP
jgi:hypothetical protein